MDNYGTEIIYSFIYHSLILDVHHQSIEQITIIERMAVILKFKFSKIVMSGSERTERAMHKHHQKNLHFT